MSYSRSDIQRLSSLRSVFLLVLVLLTFLAIGLPLSASAKTDKHIMKAQDQRQYMQRFQEVKVPLQKRGLDRQTVTDSMSESGVSASLRLSPTYPQKSVYTTSPAFVSLVVGIASFLIAGLMV